MTMRSWRWIWLSKPSSDNRLRWASHAPPKPQTRLDEISEAEFFDKTKRVEVLAKKLAREVDELAEIGSVLVVRPKAKDGLTSAETPLDFYAENHSAVIRK